MKIKKNRFRVGLLLCLAPVLCVAGLNHFAPAQIHREWQIIVADARTATAAIRYLLQPELPDFHRHEMEWAAATNLPQTVTKPAGQTLATMTNMTSVKISNGVATT
jgi:hypothetical protein